MSFFGKFRYLHGLCLKCTFPNSTRRIHSMILACNIVIEWKLPAITIRSIVISTQSQFIILVTVRSPPILVKESIFNPHSNSLEAPIHQDAVAKICLGFTKSESTE